MTPESDIEPIDIEGRLVGPTNPCFVIAEVAQNHDGSLGMAHAFVDAVADAGADAVKFQTHLADAEATPAEPFRVEFSKQDASRYEYWKRMEFTESQWQGLATHARERGLVFLSSPFSVEAVDLLIKCDVAAWKIASGEISDWPLLNHVLSTGLPILLSTGLSTLSEIKKVAEHVIETGSPLAVLQCTSRYPTPPEQVGLDLMEQFRQMLRCPVGLSDHSGQIYSGLAAVALGADILEVHVTFSRGMFGPDVMVSVTMDELRTLVEGARYIERTRTSAATKDEIAQQLIGLRDIFFKSLVARRPLQAGTIIGEGDLTAKKPGTGIQAKELESMIGRKLRRSLEADELLRPEDVE